MSIEAMKQALEALEQWNTPLYKRGNVIESLRQAIAEAKKQEPVVWMYQDKSTHEVRFQKHMRGFVDHGATYETPLYTTPQPQREWVGLTDEEMREIEKQFEAERVRTSDEEYLVIYPAAYWQWQRAIEAKLKEKNT